MAFPFPLPLALPWGLGLWASPLAGRWRWVGGWGALAPGEAVEESGHSLEARVVRKEVLGGKEGEGGEVGEEAVGGVAKGGEGVEGEDDEGDCGGGGIAAGRDGGTARVSA